MDITIEQLKKAAKVLIDDGANIEYTRGICELIADVDGVDGMSHAERSVEIAIEICSTYVANSLYP